MIFDLHNNKEAMKYIHYNSISYEKAQNDLADYISVSKLQPGFGIWTTVLKENDEVIGWTCLKKLLDSEEVEIGYRYFPQFWNNGYCTEICKKILEYGFYKLNLNEIIAIVRSENIASIRVIEKLKMQYVQMEEHYGMKLKKISIKRSEYCLK